MEVGIRLCNCTADEVSLQGLDMKKICANAPCTSRLVDVDPTEEGRKEEVVPTHQTRPLQPYPDPAPNLLSFTLLVPRRQIHKSKQSQWTVRPNSHSF